MAEWFASGRIVDLILGLVAIEAAALLGWRFWSGRGPSPVGLLANLASGAALMLAVRAALTGSDWPAIAACLLASLAAHVTEICLRVRDERARPLRGVAKAGNYGTSGKHGAFPARH